MPSVPPIAEEASHLRSLAERDHALSVPPVVQRAGPAGPATAAPRK
ncbi:hypothetical protein [Afifella sp. IM 167]|nr:hypothetical protein [Afifella sp. IM 167]